MPDLTVDTTSDVVDMDDGVLSLREALGLADASEGADTIRFADAVQGGTIMLAGSELTIASEVSIDGGDGVTIDAGGRSRVLLVQEPEFQAHAWITLAHLTITGGRTRDGQGGAGIYNAARYSALSLDHVTVTGNHAAGNGGGIGGSRVVLVRGLETDVTLQDMTITGGRVTGAYYADGGGIAADMATRLTLDRVAVVGNSSEGSGGGIWGYDMTLINSTVSGNDAAEGGGGIRGNYFDDLLLINSTLSGNHAGSGGGIAAREVMLNNSIVAGIGANGAASDIDGVVAASNGHNIFGSDVEGSVAGDLENVSASLVFAAIDPATGGGLLADHGGPTPTIALRDAPDNPALAGASAADAPATDQRGVARPLPGGTDPDIGAFEHPWLSSPADALEYVASYPDLVRALGPDAAAGAVHYRHYGAVEGRQVQFDGLEHISSHADLIAALGPDAAAGAVHFIRYGAGEGRVPDDFDAAQYLANHADLQAAFGSDTEAATVHFIRYGHGEGRTDGALDLLL